ncbi:hypothetical protein G9A89_013900 [Geosiphon pyriformis]|nr:hypothetical protein G9A89_013900 [Geosiphon pyriformis]
MHFSKLNESAHGQAQIENEKVAVLTVIPIYLLWNVVHHLFETDINRFDQLATDIIKSESNLNSSASV